MCLSGTQGEGEKVGAPGHDRALGLTTPSSGVAQEHTHTTAHITVDTVSRLGYRGLGIC